MVIFKDKRKKHIATSGFIFVIVCILGCYFVYYPKEVPLLMNLNFTFFILLTILLISSILLAVLYFYSIYFLNLIENLYHIIFGLNNWSYNPEKSYKNIFWILPLSFYLVVFWTYFKFLNCDNSFTLLLGSLTLIIVRAAHYADPKKVGMKIGEVIGAFILPFWLITFGFYFKNFLSQSPIQYIMNNLDFILNFIIVVNICFILEIIMERKGKKDNNYNINFDLIKENFSYILYLIFFIIAVIVFLILPTEYDTSQSHNLLSVIAQSEATIAGIIITLSLVAIQIGSTIYTTRIIKKFISSFDFIFITTIYIGSILFTLYILEWNLNEIYINIAFATSVFCIPSLLPYLINTMNAISPITLVREFSRDITRQSLISEDPILPISNIIESSIEKEDYTQAIKGLEILESKIYAAIQNEFNGESDEIEAMERILDRLNGIFKKSISKQQWNIAEKIINNVKKIGLITLRFPNIYSYSITQIAEFGRSGIVNNNRILIRISIQSLYTICSEAINRIYPSTLIYLIIEELWDLGARTGLTHIHKKFLINRLEDVNTKIINSNYPREIITEITSNIKTTIDAIS